VTRGQLPGSNFQSPARVLIVAAEDDVVETWKPNLYAAGADLSHVEFQDASPLEDFAAEGVADGISEWVQKRGVTLVVLDALMDHLGGAEVDEYRPRHVRRAMKPLRMIGRASGAAVLGLVHPPKGGGGDYRSQVAASHQFVAVARTGLLLVPDRTATPSASWCSCAAPPPPRGRRSRELPGLGREGTLALSSPAWPRA